MNWFRKLFRIERKDPATEAELKLQQISNILFPPLHTQTTPDGAKYQVDYSVDSNLDAALIDLEDGNNDKVSQKTIRSVANKLFKVRKLLEAYSEIDPESKFLVVDDEMDDYEYINDSESL